ncbi:hypothetical protein TrLO_g14640 [Triparma laevis f. longispina]|uniref:Uncharacterized protein n=1 Tax=Triparma laevis f. longispina TaxID=1714387 RepID=A0A9W6ZIW9_9STRA|nr:hypothetical protein TrLO_g14640 [Triparma laevis f. longispina]
MVGFSKFSMLSYEQLHDTQPAYADWVLRTRFESGSAGTTTKGTAPQHDTWPWRYQRSRGTWWTGKGTSPRGRRGKRGTVRKGQAGGTGPGRVSKGKAKRAVGKAIITKGHYYKKDTVKITTTENGNKSDWKDDDSDNDSDDEQFYERVYIGAK